MLRIGSENASFESDTFPDTWIKLRLSVVARLVLNLVELLLLIVDPNQKYRRDQRQQNRDNTLKYAAYHS